MFNDFPGEGDTSTGLQTDPTEDESEVSDILSSDSDESSLDEFKAKLEVSLIPLSFLMRTNEIWSWLGEEVDVEFSF